MLVLYAERLHSLCNDRAELGTLDLDVPVGPSHLFDNLCANVLALTIAICPDHKQRRISSFFPQI